MTSIPPPPGKNLRQQSIPAPAQAAASSSFFENGHPLGALGAPLIAGSSGQTSIPSSSGVAIKVDVIQLENDKEMEPQTNETDEEDNSVSASASSQSDEEAGKDDSDVEEQYVAENVSKKSNRSSPSVLSATIHQWPGYEEESHGLLDNNEEGSEDNSENEDPDDPWKISAEQRGWYLSLFLRLQPDFEGFIEGKDARVFFENSQLPLHDLGEIWNCSDVDRDGRLNLAEFCYAMHLSVARRHGLSLPSQLPSSLKNSTRHILKSAEENSHAATILSSGDNTHQPEWTKFSESPRNRGPIQFRSTVDTEKKLAHPVPVKASPKSSTGSSTLKASAVRDARSYSTGTVSTTMTMTTTLNTQALAPLHPPDNAMAPPPPPRSFHSRSASLDLQGQLNNSALKATAVAAQVPPQLPPRTSPIISKRLDSATSESDNDSRIPTGQATGADSMPKKPPRVSKTPNKNVSFAPAGEGNDRSWLTGAFLNPLPNILDTSDLSFPSLQDIERMKSGEIVTLIERLKIVTEGLSRQNVDLQQQLTDVVLKKRTAEVHLSAEIHREKNPHK